MLPVTLGLWLGHLNWEWQEQEPHGHWTIFDSMHLTWKSMVSAQFFYWWVWLWPSDQPLPVRCTLSLHFDVAVRWCLFHLTPAQQSPSPLNQWTCLWRHAKWAADAGSIFFRWKKRSSRLFWRIMASRTKDGGPGPPNLFRFPLNASKISKTDDWIKCSSKNGAWTRFDWKKVQFWYRTCRTSKPLVGGGKTPSIPFTWQPYRASLGALWVFFCFFGCFREDENMGQDSL